MDKAGILLHVCCAPCAVGCVERLLDENREIILYFSNSNIATQAEFEKRRSAVEELAKIYHLPLEVDTYDHAAWLEQISGLEAEPERGARCPICFGFSLARTAKRAAELNLGFTTTLTVSPYKSSQTIFKVGAQWDNFEAYDFKKRNGYQRSCELTRQYGFYRQNFCGCEFSCRPN